MPKKHSFYENFLLRLSMMWFFKIRSISSILYVPYVLLILSFAYLSESFGEPFVYVANTGSKSISVVDTETNTVIATIDLTSVSTDNPQNLVLTPDSLKAYVLTAGGASSGSISIADLSTNTAISNTSIGTIREPWPIGITPDGSLLYALNSGATANTVSVFDTASDTLSATITVGTSPYDVAFLSDSSKAYICNVLGTNVSVIDVATNTVSATLSASFPLHTTVNSDNTKAYISTAPSAILVVDVASDTITATISTGSGAPYWSLLSSDDTKLYVLDITGDRLLIINTTTNTLSKTISLSPLYTFAHMVMTPDGSKIYVPQYPSDSVAVIDTATDTLTTTIAMNRPRAIAMHPDGTYVYVTNITTDSLSVIDVATNSVIATIGVGDDPNAIQITPQTIEPVVDSAADRLLRAWQLCPISFQNDVLD